jgi:HPt (histidine-containing phosphotransfer) domain-containing protein
MTFPPEIQKRLEELRGEFVLQSRRQVDELSGLLADCDEDSAEEVASLMKRALHDIKGQAATFGFPLVSDLARSAEYDESATRELSALFETIRVHLAEASDEDAQDPAAWLNSARATF